MKVLITGQGGFIGGHLKNTLKYLYDKFSIIEINSNDINVNSKLDELVSNCDLIVHLAGVNRLENESDVYNINYNISSLINKSLKRVKFKGKLIFASSTQEMLGTFYGRAKKDSREMFAQTSKLLNFKFSGLIIPNVFGPFCKPDYNSFISTFSNNIIKNIETNVDEKSSVNLIYVQNLVNCIISEFSTPSNPKKIIDHDISVNVSLVYNQLKEFHSLYVLKNTIPSLESDFKINLFNTFRSYLYETDYFPKKYCILEDERGKFAELIKSSTESQYSFSTTNKKFTRGNHFHTRKIERFSVIQGKAIISIRQVGTSTIYKYQLDGDQPSFIDIPIWFTHNIENTGDKTLITTFWINKFYDENDTDTFFQKV